MTLCWRTSGGGIVPKIPFGPGGNGVGGAAGGPARARSRANLFWLKAGRARAFVVLLNEARRGRTFVSLSYTKPVLGFVLLL